MGTCHNETNKRRYSANNKRKFISSEKDSVSTQSYDKRRGKTPNIRVNDLTQKNRENFTEKEIFDNLSNKNNNSKFEIISKLDKISICSEQLNNNKFNDSSKINNFEKEFFFNKNSKGKNNNKKSSENNPSSKLNIIEKKIDSAPIKIMEKNEEKKEDNNLINWKLFDLKNYNFNRDSCIYAVDNEIETDKFYSNRIEYYNNIKMNLSNRIKLSNEILILPERKWYDELIDLSELLTKMRERLDIKNFKGYLSKIIKIYEDFNWLIDSVSYFYINLKNKNLHFNKEKIGLPDIKSEKWKNGFTWKGLYIKINEGEDNKIIINEIKALNYYFFDYIQIIDKHQILQDDQLSNMIIFPLIGYSIIHGKTLIVSSLINSDENNYKIIRKYNGILKFFFNENNININKNINNNKIDNNNLENEEKNLINTMEKNFYIDDLLISKLFFNLDDNNFIKIKNNKYIIFNLYKKLPNLFSIKFDFIKKINFFSKINNKRIFYSLNYDTKNKTNIHKESKYNNPNDVIGNIYHMNYFSSIKVKDILINNIHFRILYENEIQNLDDIKNNSSLSSNFVDNLFNYNYTKKNISIKTKIKEPYVIIYDLLEPIKLKYSLIKSNKNYVSKEQKINMNQENNNIEKQSKKLFYYHSNFISYFTSWCKTLSQNSFNIKSYSDLKQYMTKHGINSILKFFSLVIIDNQEITDIIKISFLIKGIKFAFYKDNNINNFNYNEEGIKYLLIKYIKSILYPNEILQKEKAQFEIIFKELVFYSNILFFKLKLIDYYLNLDILSSIDIKGLKIDKNNVFNLVKEEKIKIISKKLTGFNSPENFLIDIISIARKKPFLFLSELEKKLNFIINPFIKFKSSLSIESMSNQLNMNHIYLNFNYKTFSYIKSNEISGLILSKIINIYNSYDLNGNNKEYVKNNNDNEKDSDNNSYYSRSTKNTKSLIPLAGDNTSNYAYIFNENININNACEENITDNSEASKEYISDNDKLKNLNNQNKNQKEKNYNISSLNSTHLFSTNNNPNDYNNNEDSNKVEWDSIKNEFLFELPAICYKMKYNSINEKQNKFGSGSLYKNLSNIYKIGNPKIIIEWNENLEKMFSKTYSYNGEVEHSLLYSLFYLFIYKFFFEKKKEECKNILKKINYFYQNGGYRLSLNDLIIINLFNSLLNKNYIKSEEYFSRSVMLILLSYGDPRGRNNDSHGILGFPLWNICRRTLKFEHILISEYFREMFHALDYFEWQKSLLKENKASLEKDEIINFSRNIIKNSNEILLINNINKNELTNKDNNDSNNSDEYKLSEKIFEKNILDLKIIKHFNFPKLSDFNDKESNIYDNKDFILYFMKQMQSLFMSKKILLDQNYINDEISNEIFNPDKDNNSPNNYVILNNKLNLKNYNNNFRYNGIMNGRLSKNNYYSILSNIKNNTNNKFNRNISEKNSKQYKRPLSGANNIKCVKNKSDNVFSHFLYKELLEKLSYSKNMPSGVAFSFGNNKHSETSHDNVSKLTLPRIIFKLKNEYVDKIYAGWEHNLIINKKGEIFSFGNNKSFQCGIPNSNGFNDKINNPTNISVINNNIKAISASCGNEHSLILKNDNSVYAFGINEEGELGLKDKSIKTYKFNKINFGKYSNQIIQISAGTVHNLALTKDGKVFSWGSSQGGQLGISEDYLINQPEFKDNFVIYNPTIIHFNKNIINSVNNIQDIRKSMEMKEEDDFIVKISCGEAHSIALSKKGSVYSWGFGSNGQLGLGFCEDTFEPGYGTQSSRKFTPQYIKYLENENIIDIHCGKTFSMFINDRKEIFGTGVNDINQLGINEKPLIKKNEIMCYDIVFPTILDYLIEKKVQKLSCGEGHCLAIINYPENSRVIWSWGNNKFGQLGHGSWIPKSMPKPINYLLGFNNDKIQFEEVACGGFHSLCVIKYKNNLNWIEDDFNKIVEVINNKDNYEKLNINDRDIKSEKISYINFLKFS